MGTQVRRHELVVIHHRIADKHMKHEWAQWGSHKAMSREGARELVIGNLSAAEASQELHKQLHRVAHVLTHMKEKAAVPRCFLATNSLRLRLLVEQGGHLHGCGLFQVPEIAAPADSFSPHTDEASNAQNLNAATVSTLVDWHVMRMADTLFIPSRSGLSSSAGMAAMALNGSRIALRATESGQLVEASIFCAPRFC